MKATFEIEGNEVRLFCSCGGCCTAVTFDIYELLKILSFYVVKTYYTEPLVIKSGITQVVLLPTFIKKLFRELKKYYEEKLQ